VSIDELVTGLLTDALETEADEFPTLEEVVAKIKATPPNPACIRPATGSLAEALQNAPHDSDFDLETWTRQWAEIEAEMKAITRANDIAEGRA
jgi:cell pole-organizing protein PopZ